MLNEDIAAAPQTKWALNIHVSVSALEIISFNDHLTRCQEGLVCGVLYAIAKVC